MHLLTLEEVAAELRIGRSTAYLMAQRGELPVCRFGSKLIRVPREEFDRWLAKRVGGGNVDDGTH